MESSDPMRVDQWSSPPPLLASPPFDNNTFAIAPQASSDASSTTTSTLTTALNSSESEEAGSSSRTTPAISDVSEDLSKNQDDEVSKQIVTEAAQVQNATPAVVADHSDLQTTTTRRRSSRLSAFKTPANTSTPKASATSGTAPATPHPRTNTTTLETPANSGNASSSTTGSASRALRSSARKEDPKESPAPEIKEQPQEETGRRTRRQSAINALAKLTETAPRNAKRSHEAMETGSKSADPKIPGSSLKKAKPNDATSSPQPSETSDISEIPSEEPHRPKKRRKVWINQGLYVGQDDADEKTLNMRPATKNKKGKKSQAPRPNALPTPIFRGKEIMNTVRDFKLPFHVFAPLPIKPPVPKDWRKLNHNQLIGDAQQIWRKEKSSTNKCVCTKECDESCLNRVTWVECTDGICPIGRHCGNRAFADLMDRVKLDTKFAIGVEVELTGDCGYGLRAMRSFEPGQIIVEYTGEIITQEESDRRLDEVYKDSTNYYLMLFDQNMILDATRGSIARFVNHSCDPNCRMEKWLVGGKPRMALFAGDNGVEAGDELTYDYNFTWFKGVTQIQCKCGTEKCRGVLGKRSDRKSPLKKETEVDAKASKKGKNAKAKKVYKKRVVTERIQQSVIINPVKKARKPPFPRRPPTPPPVEDSKTATPELEGELEPLPTSDDDSGLSDVEDTPMTTVDTTPKPLTKTTRLRTKPLKTYKINKTIAKSSVSKTVTSKAAVMAAKNGALDEVLAEAAGKENTSKVSRMTVTTTMENTSTQDVEMKNQEKSSVDDILNRLGTVNDVVPKNAAVAVSA